jgi:hypothetical protein
VNDTGPPRCDDQRVNAGAKEVIMSIESDADQDLALNPEQAEGVAGGRKAKKAAHFSAKPAPSTMPLVVNVQATAPPIPGPADPGADNSGPEADDC